MGCLSSRYSEDHEHTPTSTKVEFEETSFTESEAHARTQMIIDVKDGQAESKDCLQGLDSAETGRDMVNVTGETNEMSEVEAQLTSPTDITSGEESSSWTCPRPPAKSVTLSMAESKGPRYWAQDLKG